MDDVLIYFYFLPILQISFNETHRSISCSGEFTQNNWQKVEQKKTKQIAATKENFEKDIKPKERKKEKTRPKTKRGDRSKMKMIINTNN